MFEVIENLIQYKFYESLEEIIKKITMYNSYKVLTDDEYKKLMELSIEKYNSQK